MWTTNVACDDVDDDGFGDVVLIDRPAMLMRVLHGSATGLSLAPVVAGGLAPGEACSAAYECGDGVADPSAGCILGLCEVSCNPAGPDCSGVGGTTCESYAGNPGLGYCLPP
jgi:hypothetical protein